MGCWNQTCGFSNLPITTDSPALLMLIAESKSASDDYFFYGFDIFQPLTPLVPVEYDDYGGAILTESNLAALLDIANDPINGTVADGVKPLGPDQDRRNILPLNGTEYVLPHKVWPWFMRQDAYDVMMGMTSEDWRGISISESEKSTRQKFSDEIVSSISDDS